MTNETTRPMDLFGFPRSVDKPIYFDAIRITKLTDCYMFNCWVNIDGEWHTIGPTRLINPSPTKGVLPNVPPS